MIYTITPNPVLDLGGTVDQLIPNEKAYIQNETRFPGGNAINAARIIKKFGLPVIASGFLGGGIGKEVENLLVKEKVRCNFISIRGNTRIGVTVSNCDTHLQTRLSFPGPKIQSAEVEKLNHWIKSINPPALIIIGGSLPPGFSISSLKQLISIAFKRGIPCVVDVPGNTLKKLMHTHLLFIKPNLTEFQEMIGKKVYSISDVSREARKMNSNIPLICISSVEDGALLVTKEKIWFGQIPRVRIKTTVGAGDSMVGAISAQIWKNRKFFIPNPLNSNHFENVEDLLRWGLAAATATLITPGTTLGDYRHIVRYFPKVKIKEIKI